jgi:hypothetical protein
MRRVLFLLIAFFLFVQNGFSQARNTGEGMVLFHGLISDAGTLAPLPNSQIFINRIFISSSDPEGKFAFYINRRDTVVVRSLGYQPARVIISDTLMGKEFVSGIFMHTDTLEIPEVIIVPRMAAVKSDLMKPPSEATRQMENARYNLAVSSYQGRVNQNKLGDAAMNYEVIKQNQKDNAYSKGQIPSDKILGISPLLLIPAAYLLIKGFPEKPSAVRPAVTDQEVEMINKKYIEKLQKEK